MSLTGSFKSRFGLFWQLIYLAVVAGFSGSPAAAIIPGTPTNPTARAVDAYTVEFSWSVNAVDVNNIQGFSVGTNPGAQQPYRDPTLRSKQFRDCPGKLTTYVVAAYNQEGASPWAQTSFALPNQVPAGAPALAAFPDSTTQITINFALPCNATGVKIERATSSTLSPPPESAFSEIMSVSPITLSQLYDRTPLPNVRYYYRARAFNALGVSTEYSPIVSTIIEMLAPNRPIAIIRSLTQVDLFWEQDNRMLVNSYVVERRSDAVGSSFIQVGATLVGYEQLYGDTPPGQGTYYYRVKAVSTTLGSSPYSPEGSIVFGPPTAAPSNLSVIPIPGGAGLQINWTDNASNEMGEVVERATSPSGPFTPLYTKQNAWPPSYTYYDDTAASPNVTYYYRVFAFNVFADSAYSNTASGSFSSSGGSLQPPVNLRVKAP